MISHDPYILDYLRCQLDESAHQVEKPPPRHGFARRVGGDGGVPVHPTRCPGHLGARCLVISVESIRFIGWASFGWCLSQVTASSHLKSPKIIWIFFFALVQLVLTRRNCSKLLPRLLYCQSTWPGVWRMLSWPPHIVTWMLTDACRKLRTCAGQWLNWIYAWASWGVWTLDQVRVWQDGAVWGADMPSASQCQLWTWTWMNGHFSGEWVVCIQ